MMYWTLLLPFAAVLIGFLLSLWIKSPHPKMMKWVLAFSGAFLLSSMVHEFMPAIFTYQSSRYAAFIIVGVFLQIVLEFFSKGAEHGHLHHNTNGFQWLLFVSLCIHALIEGMPLSQSSGMLYGVSVHKLPIAFIFSSLLLSAYNWKKSLLIIILFGLMSPIGTMLQLQSAFSDDMLIIVQAIVAGIVLHVSTTLILEANEGHKFNIAKLAIMALGAALGLMI